jgi:ATP-dependent Clp protease ATP-binding subunit ClpB
VKSSFRPEFVNRIDEVVVFHALDEKHIRSIARIQLGYLERRLAQLDMRLETEESAIAEVSAAGFDPVFGARPLKRAIQSQIENPLAKAILEGRFAAGDVIRVSCVGGGMRFEKG